MGIAPFDLLSPMAILGYWTDRWKLTRWITWIWMDDSRFELTKTGYAKDYWIYIQDRGKTKETWWIFIQWHIKRNRKYNLVNLFKVPNSNKYNSDGKLIGNNFIGNVQFIGNNLHKKDGSFIDQDGNWVIMAGLKYVPIRKDDDPYQVNVGEEISKKTSIIGSGGMWYPIGNWYSFRWSYCKEVTHLFFWKRWRTIKIGTNSNRYTISFKHQKLKSWK